MSPTGASDKTRYTAFFNFCSLCQRTLFPRKLSEEAVEQFEKPPAAVLKTGSRANSPVGEEEEEEEAKLDNGLRLFHYPSVPTCPEASRGLKLLTYKIAGEIREKLGLGDTLRKQGFNIGFTAEIIWALKRMILAKHSNVKPVVTRSDSRNEIQDIAFEGDMAFEGGVGGPGGFGALTGGAGGAGFGGSYDLDALVSAAMAGSNQKRAIGGQGRHGQHGQTQGGAGGIGHGPIISADQLNLFRHITGGTGGSGGKSAGVGGRGGAGHAAQIVDDSPILIISNHTRSQISNTSLEVLGVEPGLTSFLKFNGFRTVGGLLEAHTRDLESVPQYLAPLKASLEEICRLN
ncbi:hypothetical protein R3P38DRAFT_3376244 [Favolaschia claudopus]|uniref:Uncharacterized protein n=1 Tax=Favolaschia claudopus TaxID=2862362 RepID=A0AAV9ZEK2_9AGAR